MSQHTAQRVISGDPEALAALANIHVDNISIPPPPLVASTGPTSSPSSSTSISNVDTVDRDTRSSSSDGRDSQEGLGGGWRELHPRPPTSQSETTASTSLQSEPESQSSCCCAPPTESNDGGSEINDDVITPRYVEQSQNLGTVTSSYQAVGGLTQTLDPAPNPNQFNMQDQDDVKHLNTNFSTYELSAGCDGMQNGTSGSIPETGLAHSQASCDCGDGCECFACAQHPKNRTTLDYVRYHNELFMREAQVPQPGYGENHLNYQLTMHMQYTQQLVQPFGPQPVIGDQPVSWPHSSESSIPDTPNKFTHDQFQFQSRSQAISPGPTSNLEAVYTLPGRPFTPTFARETVSPRNSPAALEPMQHPQTMNRPADADSPVDNDGVSALSPSSFLLHQYTLPDCDNFYGTCRCGDGCSCDGCLTHSGHDGFGTSAAGETAAATTNGTGAVDANGWNGLYTDQGGIVDPLGSMTSG
jgi:hypothetical protein